VTRTRDSNSTTVLTSTAATTGNIVSTAALKTTYRAKNSTSTSTSPITAINTTVATSQLPVNPQTTAAAYVDNYAPDGSDYNYTYEYGSGDGNTSGGGDDEDYELPISPDEDYNTFSKRSSLYTHVLKIVLSFCITVVVVILKHAIVLVLF